MKFYSDTDKAKKTVSSSTSTHIIDSNSNVLSSTEKNIFVPRNQNSKFSTNANSSSSRKRYYDNNRKNYTSNCYNRDNNMYSYYYKSRRHNLFASDVTNNDDKYRSRKIGYREDDKKLPSTTQNQVHQSYDDLLYYDSISYDRVSMSSDREQGNFGSISSASSSSGSSSSSSSHSSDINKLGARSCYPTSVQVSKKSESIGYGHPSEGPARRYVELPLEFWERSPECRLAKLAHMDRVDALCDSRERLVRLTALAHADTVLEANMFPYDTPKGIKHYTLWSLFDLSHKQIVAFVDAYLSRNHPSVRRWQYDDNVGERSVNLFHVHVYIEFDPYSFIPRPSQLYVPEHMHLLEIEG